MSCWLLAMRGDALSQTRPDAYPGRRSSRAPTARPPSGSRAEAALRAADARHAYRRAVAVGHLAQPLLGVQLPQLNHLLTSEVLSAVARAYTGPCTLQYAGFVHSEEDGGSGIIVPEFGQELRPICTHISRIAELLDERLPLGEGARRCGRLRDGHEPLMWSQSCSPLYHGPHLDVFWTETSTGMETPAFGVAREGSHRG